MGIFHNEYVIFALVAVAIFTVYMSAVTLLRKDPMRERLKKTLPMDTTGIGYEETRSQLALGCESVLNAIGTDVVKVRRDMYLPLARAGMMSSDSIVYFMFFKRFIQPLLAILGIIVLLQFFGGNATGMTRMMYLIVAAVFLLLGISGGNLYLSNRTQKRKKVLQKSLADALDLLLVCVESGLPLDSALARVCRELNKAHPEVTEELDRTRIELNVLSDRIQALQNLADRTDTPGFKTLVTSLMQSEKFGTSIAETLRVLSEDYRNTRMMNAENRAARIPALITVPLIAFILLPFLALIIAPPIIRINQQGGMFGNANQNPPPKSNTSR